MAAAMKCAVALCPKGVVELIPVKHQMLHTCCGIELPTALFECVDSIQMTLRNAEHVRVGSLDHVHNEPFKWIMPHATFTNTTSNRWEDIQVVKFQLQLPGTVQLQQLKDLTTGIRPINRQEGLEAWIRTEAGKTANSALLRKLFVQPSHLAALMAVNAPATSIVGVVGTVSIPPPSSTVNADLTLHLRLPPPAPNCILLESWTHVHGLGNACVEAMDGSGKKGAAKPKTMFLDKTPSCIPPLFQSQWWFRVGGVLSPSAEIDLHITPMNPSMPVQTSDVHAVNIVSFYLEVPDAMVRMDTPLNGPFPAVKCSTSLSSRLWDEKGFQVTRWQIVKHKHVSVRWLTAEGDNKTVAMM